MSKKKTKFSSDDVVKRMLIHIATRLQEEDSIQLKCIKFSPVQLDGLSQKDDMQLQILHNEILKKETASTELHLIACYERGKFYSLLKNSHKNWETFCVNHLNLCSRSIKRYVDFFHLCSVYPRLVVCGLTMTEIMMNRAKLVDKIENNPTLSQGLKQEFRTIKVEQSLIPSWSRSSSMEIEWQCDEREITWASDWQFQDVLEEEAKQEKETTERLKSVKTD